MKITKRHLRRLIREMAGPGRKTVLLDDGQGGMADVSPQFGYVIETGEKIMWEDMGLEHSDWEAPHNVIQTGLKSLGITHVQDPDHPDAYDIMDGEDFPIDMWTST